MTYNDLPKWFKAQLARVGSDAANWPTATNRMSIDNLPDFLRKMFEIAWADPGAWYDLETKPGSFETAFSYMRGICSAIGAPVAPITVYLDDKCTGAFSATISGRMPDTVGVNTWVDAATGTKNMTVTGSSSFGVEILGTGSASGYYDVGVTEYTYTVDVKLDTWTAALVRYVDVNNHYDIGISTTSLSIRERTSGTATTRSSAAGSFSNGTTYTLEITVTSSGISAAVGAISTSYNSTTKNTSTNIGATPLSSASGHEWTNFKVTS